MMPQNLPARKPPFFSLLNVLCAGVESMTRTGYLDYLRAHYPTCLSGPLFFQITDGQLIVVSVEKNSMAFLWLIVVHPQTDFYTKFVTSFRRSSWREAKKRSIFISLFFSPHKIGHLRRLWNVYRWCGIRIPKYFTELIRPSRHASWMWSFLDSLLLSHLVSLLSALCCVCVWDSWQKILAN